VFLRHNILDVLITHNVGTLVLCYQSSADLLLRLSHQSKFLHLWPVCWLVLCYNQLHDTSQLVLLHKRYHEDVSVISIIFYLFLLITCYHGMSHAADMLMPCTVAEVSWCWITGLLL